jgi:hypothetical protein
MKHNFPNNCLAAHLGGGSRGQGGAQQGTRARGEQYLDGASRSHTLAAGQLFGITNTNNPSAPIPFFRSKPTLQKIEDEDENEDEDERKLAAISNNAGESLGTPLVQLP